MYITSGLEQSQVDRFRHGFVASVVGMKVVAANEAKRQAVNVWIRTSGEYDGVIDFDEATRDFSAPSWLRRIYDSKTVHSVKSTRTYDPGFR